MNRFAGKSGWGTLTVQKFEPEAQKKLLSRSFELVLSKLAERKWKKVASLDEACKKKFI